MFTLNCKGRILTVDKPIVMGIINATPDSFYSGSRQQAVDDILREAEKMLKEGAAILDIGGQSTRPGAEKISEQEELQRVVEPVAAIHKNFPEAFISIDTYYSNVAAATVAAGASIINDISAGSIDEDMIQTVAGLNVPYVLMHIKGTPQTMKQEAVYENVTTEVLDYFIEKKNALHRSGIKDIIIDCGFGFAKNAGHNFELLRNMSLFRMLDAPILLGISRKSFIYKTLGVAVEESLNGTTVLNTVGLMNGASILRVHDVKEAVEAVTLFQNLTA